jgi:hypothetical protein
MIEWSKFFRSPGSIRSGSFDYEEIGIEPDGSRLFIILGLDKRTGIRTKVCEFRCLEGDKICRERIIKKLKKLNR